MKITDWNGAFLTTPSPYDDYNLFHLPVILIASLIESNKTLSESWSGSNMRNVSMIFWFSRGDVYFLTIIKSIVELTLARVMVSSRTVGGIQHENLPKFAVFASGAF